MTRNNLIHVSENQTIDNTTISSFPQLGKIISRPYLNVYKILLMFCEIKFFLNNTITIENDRQTQVGKVSSPIPQKRHKSS